MKPSLFKLVVLIAALSGLPACTVGPTYRRPDIASPPSFAEAPITAEAGLDSSSSDLSTWWTAFDDPTLNDLVRRALANNLDLETAASRLRQARQQERIAAGAEYPTLSAGGNALTYNSNKGSSSQGATASSGGSTDGDLPIPAHFNLYTAGFDASWEVDIFGGTRRSIEAARADIEAVEWARRDVEVSLLAEVANAYLTLRALQARIALGEQELKRQNGVFELIHARRATGFVTGLDVDQQSVQVATAAAQIPQLQAQAKVQVHALGVLIGEQPEALIASLGPVANPLPPLPPTLPLGLPSDLLKRRPDIREAERRLAAASANIGVQQASLYPKLNLLGMASFTSPTISNLFNSDNLGSAGLGMITQPLFNGGRNQAQIRLAKDQYQEALISYKASVLTAFRDCEDALARYKSEDNRRASLVQSVKASKNSLKIAEDQYGAGLVTFINVLQAEVSVLNSQDQLIQSDAQALSDLVSVYKALGGGWSTSPDLKQAARRP